MPRKRSVIAAAPMADILKTAGAERVSDKAAKALSEALMDIAIEISKDAIRFANHAGRKTIKREDIELARKNI
ncbi:MAG: NFYB/HAP3 family transcription factor subunit [Nanoarchaeota archaeon]|nr:NFYB/HAP3 family transcription factor subunit [Nanoarchaeota archaeon]